MVYKWFTNGLQQVMLIYQISFYILNKIQFFHPNALQSHQRPSWKNSSSDQNCISSQYTIFKNSAEIKLVLRQFQISLRWLEPAEPPKFANFRLASQAGLISLLANLNSAWTPGAYKWKPSHCVGDFHRSQSKLRTQGRRGVLSFRRGN